MGWAEGTSGDDDSSYGMDGYLFYQLAEELCERFDSCDEDGSSIINPKLMEQFTIGQEKLKDVKCLEAKAAKETIEKLLQAIIVDNLAYHAKFADSQEDDQHCLMAHVTDGAEELTGAVTSIEIIVTASYASCQITSADLLYIALNDYVEYKEIDCDWLGSSVCSDTSTVEDSVGYEDNNGYNAQTEDDDHTLLNGEYVPIAQVRDVVDGMSSVMSAICDTEDKAAAKKTYLDDESAGITIEDMSITAKYVMADELQFNQYVFALKDTVDKTDGSFMFDGKLASEYANTITDDAIDTSTRLGCRAVKVLNIWMWIVHKRKLNRIVMVVCDIVVLFSLDAVV